MRQALGITVLMLAVAATPPVEAAAQDIVDRVLAAAVESRTNDLGHREADLGDGHVFVLVPAGPFAMGSEEGLDDELPVHEVELDDYWIAAFPVTVGQFRAFVEATGYVTDAERGMGSWQWTGEIPGPGDRGDPWRPMSDGAWYNIYFEQGGDHAVGSVSWNDAQAFCAWLSEQLGVPVVLPTEAQWEKAARGTDGRRFPWGNDAPDGNRANYADVSFIGKYGEYTRRSDSTVDDGHVETSPVDAYPASPLLTAGADLIGYSTYRRQPGHGLGVSVINHGARELGVFFVEVKVNRRTGLVRVKRVCCALDIGTVINQRNCTVNVRGAIMWGIGYCLVENLGADRHRVHARLFGEYEVPRFRHTPEIQIAWLQAYPDNGPRGVGEMPCPAIAPAVPDAIHDAVGIRLYQTPFTPERVLAALRLR